eukprot:gb/GEZJ01001214.1/.p3 GENE.gb/GEZJ01001214.1/~~gb/GEZJ01001214.1/.p3  ORF type:complete len:102 (+),score=4.05 gb/GEZJ01001214.1/:1464-1769(+)
MFKNEGEYDNLVSKNFSQIPKFLVPLSSSSLPQAGNFMLDRELYQAFLGLSLGVTALCFYIRWSQAQRYIHSMLEKGRTLLVKCYGIQIPRIFAQSNSSSL